MLIKSRVHADSSLNQDHFDQLPDSLLLLIFNKLADVHSLGRCLAVSKRFNSLVPLVHDLFVKIDRLAPVDGDCDVASLSSPNIFAHLLKLILLTILRPFHHLLSTNGGNKPLSPQFSHHSPSQILKNFTQVQNLRIELPAGDVGTDNGVFLKWRAEFGSTLQNCVVLGGTRIEHGSNSVNLQGPVEDDGRLPESFYTDTDGGLKLRVIWTISSLLAASTRHYLLHQIVKEHTTLRSLVSTDADGQGTLTMGLEQLKEFREKPLAPSSSSNRRTQVPASKMKLRYAPYLELPERVGVQGATLLIIKPVGEGTSCDYGSEREMEAFGCGTFDGPFRAAVKALGKRRTYLSEMNGF